MTEEDKPKFCEIVAAIATTHGRPVDEPLFAGWWMAMRSWSLEEFSAAAEHVMHTADRMPVPGNFNALRQAGQETAGEAWLRVLGGEPLSPGSRACRVAAMLGGQQNIRHADLKTELPHLHRRFLELYAELARVEPVREALPAITLASERRTLIGEAVNKLEVPTSPRGGKSQQLKRIQAKLDETAVNR